MNKRESRPRKGVFMWKFPAVALAAVLGISACSKGGPVIDDVTRAAQRWIGHTDEIVAGSKGFTNPTRIRTGDEALKTRLSTHVDTATPISADLSQELQATLRTSIDQAKRLQMFYIYLDDISARVASIDTAVTSMVSTATQRYNVKAEAKRLLEDAGQDILHDVTCDLAWSLMRPNEQYAANSSGFDRVNDIIRDLEQQAPGALVEAIGGYLQSRYLKLFNDSWAVDLALYGEEVYEKAGELTADGQETLDLPDGTATKALILYARLCLRPPT